MRWVKNFFIALLLVSLTACSAGMPQDQDGISDHGKGENHPPVIEVFTPINSTALVAGNKVKMTILTKDEDGDPLLLHSEILEHPGEGELKLIDCNSPNPILLPPKEGKYSLKLTASDGKIATYLIREIFVEEFQVFCSPKDGAKDLPLNTDLTITANGENVTHSVSISGPGVYVNISSTKEEHIDLPELRYGGTYHYTVISRNNGVVEKTVTGSFSTAAQNGPPAISSIIADPNVIEGEPKVGFKVTAEDYEGNVPLNFHSELIFKPADSQVELADPNMATPFIQGKISAGNYKLKVQVMDSLGNMAEQEFVINVKSLKIVEPQPEPNSSEMPLRPRFSFQPNVTAAYTLQLSKAFGEEFENQAKEIELGDSNSYSLTYDLDPNSAYYWRVKASRGEISRIFPEGGEWKFTTKKSVAGNNPPVVVLAASNLNPYTDEEVVLRASQSYDPDPNDTLTFLWSIKSGPAGASIADANHVEAKFISHSPGSYSIECSVSDKKSQVAKSLAIVVQEKEDENYIPIAKIEILNLDPNDILVGDAVLLGADGSSDKDGDLLTYNWQFVMLPSGSSATFSDTNTVETEFIADKVGPYVISLIVNDGKVDSDPETVTVRVKEDPTYLKDFYPQDANIPVSGAEIRWNSNAGKYDVWFGTDPNNIKLVSENQTALAYVPPILGYETNYYYKIVAHTEGGRIKEGPVINFKTAAEKGVFRGDDITLWEDGRFEIRHFKKYVIPQAWDILMQGGEAHVVGDLVGWAPNHKVSLEKQADGSYIATYNFANVADVLAKGVPNVLGICFTQNGQILSGTNGWLQLQGFISRDKAIFVRSKNGQLMSVLVPYTDGDKVKFRPLLPKEDGYEMVE